MMADLLDIFRDSGCAYGQLMIREKNTKAPAFYERHGWERDGTTEPVDERLAPLVGSLAYPYVIDIRAQHRVSG